ncbi:MAG: Gfo/Idh/MocA family oxidoreductase, partial [bacterium]|nr:Gfo/Idh/MocA family oxidoreductase [bacterium]
MDTLNFILIGAGGMGKRWAGAISRNAHTKLCAVIDTDLERAKKVSDEFGAEAHGSLESVGEFDAAVVVLPHNLLAETGKKILTLGKHVIVEKPAARTLQELTEVVALAKEKHRTFMVAYNHRFHPSSLEAKKLIDEGFIGKPMFMRAVYGFGGRPDYEKEWRHKKEISGGGELIDQGVHLIDFARWFLGDIAEAKGMLENAFWKSGVEDNAFVLLQHASGAVSSLHASWSQWKATYALEIEGTDGYIRIEGLGKKYGGTERVYYAKRKDDFSAPEEQMIECDTNADRSLERTLDEFVSAIQEKREPKPSGEDG